MKQSRADYMREYRAKKKQVRLVTPLKDVEPMHDPVTESHEAQPNPQGDVTNPHMGYSEQAQLPDFKKQMEALQMLQRNVNVTSSVTQTSNSTPDKEIDYKPYFLLSLLLAGSFFLVTEQVTFYRACGYNLPYSIFLAVLLEITPLSLAYFASVYKKPLLNIAIIPAIFCIGAVIFLGLQGRANSAENVTRASDILASQIEVLQEQAKTAEGKKLERLQSEILKKQELLREQLPKKQADTIPELWIFAVIRFFAFVYNLIFAKLLANYP